MFSAPMRLFRPDFRTIFRNLCFSEREIIVQTMDATYDIITKTVDDEALDKTHTARLVDKYVKKVQESENCFAVIMGAIWPPANNATETPPSGGPSTSNPTGSGSGSTHSYWFQPSNSGFINVNGEDFPQHFQSSGTRGHRTHRGQPSLRGRGRGAPRGRGSTSTPNPASNYHFTRNINYYPMPSGRKLKRENAFTELSSPGAQTIVLGPLPPPTLPPHVRTSTLPPGHPPQSYGTGAFPPSYNIPGASSSDSNSGVAPGIAEEAASAPSTQPVLSLDSSKISRKRSCDDLK